MAYEVHMDRIAAFAWLILLYVAALVCMRGFMIAG